MAQRSGNGVNLNGSQTMVNSVRLEEIIEGICLAMHMLSREPGTRLHLSRFRVSLQLAVFASPSTHANEPLKSSWGFYECPADVEAQKLVPLRISREYGRNFLWGIRRGP